MKNMAPPATVPIERRKQLLEGVPGFRGVPARVLKELAAGLDEEHFPLGAIVVADGEYGDRLFVIEDGEVELSVPEATTAVSLAILRPGDMFGQLALFSSTRRSEVTATAMTPLTMLGLTVDVFQRTLDVYPQARVDFMSLAEALLTDKCLQQHGSWYR